MTKFGGAALEDGAAVRRVGAFLRRDTGTRQVLVVSAHRGVTEELRSACVAARSGRLAWDAVRVRHRTILRQLELPGDLLDRHLQALRALLAHLAGVGHVDARQRDHVLSFGERMSARVVAAHLRAGGIAAAAVDAFDLGLVHHPERPAPAESRAEERAALRDRLLAIEGVPVVTGFVALDPVGDLTTLGPNGSDLTATWLAEALGASRVELWKPVPGIFSADPKLVPDARRLERIGWEDAAALALQGADVLHPTAGAPARRAGIPVRVRGYDAPDEAGTLVSDALEDPRGPLALAHRKNVAVLDRVTGAEGREHVVRSELELLGIELEAQGLQPLSLVSDGARATLLLPDGPECARLLQGRTRPGDTWKGGWSQVALIGRGVERDVELARKLLECAGSEARLVPPRAGSRARSVLVPRERLTDVASRLHAEVLAPAGDPLNASGSSRRGLRAE